QSACSPRCVAARDRRNAAQARSSRRTQWFRPTPLAAIAPLWLSLVVIAPALLWFFRRRGSTPGWALPLAAVAVAVGVVIGGGFVTIPSLEDLPLQEKVGDVGDAVGHWAYPIVGVLAFLETGAFVGLVAPGETFVILGGVLSGEGTLSFFLLLAIVWASAFLGDAASFGLGRRLGRGFLERHGPKVKITPDRLASVERFLEKHGGKAIVIGRFIGFVRAVAPFILGSSGLSWRRFLPYAVIGSGLWSALFVTLGYAFWQSLDKLLGWIKQGAFAFGTVVAIAVAVIALVHWLGVEGNRDKAAAWIEEAQQTRWGRMLLAVWRPVSVPVRFAWHRITPGGIGLEATTLAAVVAVGTFAFVGLESTLDDRGPSGLTAGDVSTLDWVERLTFGPADDLSRIGVVVGSYPVVGILAVLAAFFLASRRRVGAAIALVVATTAALGIGAIVRGSEDRLPPPGALEHVGGASFPSPVAVAAVVLVAIALALSPAVRRIPGRVGLTGLAAILAAAICTAPLVLRTAYLSDVLAGAGLSAAIMAAVGIVAIVVGHIRHTPDA
ncbi:VTT domain-containing protein, partial [Patulibacter sp. NPDC049589]|uniref:VTT domain-containing protein n=1 Tax=Patulibacter sp. NPDC049589 TaxID=3154731 RepID=UPI00343EE4C5